MPEAVPESAPAPLREAVLAGRYFGARHRDVAERFARFIAEPKHVLAGWFGPELAGPLAADRDRMNAVLDRDIAAIDAMIARQLDAILHHARLRKLEGSWRGLAWLTSRMSLGGRVKLRILTVSWAEICRDLGRRSLTRASYSGGFMRMNSALPAASLTGCWWWTMRCATGRVRGR
jgi:type VI secretion system protein ImpD/type VI secretion system protein ImpC